jgi:hypothetical protein
MDNKEIVDAIHQLELNLTERIHVQTEMMAVTNERLDNLRVAVDRHREILYGHDDGDNEGLLSKMRALEKTETERRLSLRGVTAAFIGVCGKLIWDLFHG